MADIENINSSFERPIITGNNELKEWAANFNLQQFGHDSNSSLYQIDKGKNHLSSYGEWRNEKTYV